MNTWRIVLLASILSTGCAARVSPRVFVIDPHTGDWAPLVIKKDTKIYVLGPHGPEEGLNVGGTDDGKAILLVPPSTLQPKADDYKEDYTTPLKEAEADYGSR